MYALFINGVLFDYFKTLKEIDFFIFDNGIDLSRYFIQVKKVPKK